MQNKLTVELIKNFLLTVDELFEIPISHKQDITEFAEKLFSFATICAEIQDDKILSMVAGYTENLSEKMAYISVVATIKEASGKGLATKCLRKFIDICKDKSIGAVHLYTTKDNITARNMYEKVGFTEFKPEKEERPQDIHLIYKVKE